MKEFLHCLAGGQKLSLADRKQDRARQAARKAGYAVYEARFGGPEKWHITAKGCCFLSYYPTVTA